MRASRERERDQKLAATCKRLVDAQNVIMPQGPKLPLGRSSADSRWRRAADLSAAEISRRVVRMLLLLLLLRLLLWAAVRALIVRSRQFLYEAP